MYNEIIYIIFFRKGQNLMSLGRSADFLINCTIERMFKVPVKSKMTMPILSCNIAAIIIKSLSVTLYNNVLYLLIIS